MVGCVVYHLFFLLAVIAGKKWLLKQINVSKTLQENLFPLYLVVAKMDIITSF